jgi:hypothetical protein
MASVSARILGALYRRDPRGSTTTTEKERTRLRPDTQRRDVDARLPRHRLLDAPWPPDVHRIPTDVPPDRTTVGNTTSW